MPCRLQSLNDRRRRANILTTTSVPNLRFPDDVSSPLSVIIGSLLGPRARAEAQRRRTRVTHCSTTAPMLAKFERPAGAGDDDVSDKWGSSAPGDAPNRCPCPVHEGFFIRESER